MHHRIHTGKVDKKTKSKRALWNIACFILFRPFPTPFFWIWRRFILSLFGARIHPKANVYSSAKIWAPWNLSMDEGACLGPNVICYNQAFVKIGKNATISQDAYLCTASHDPDRINNADNGLLIANITIHKKSWVGTRAFISLGVEIGEGSIVGATASVFKDVEPYTIVGGNPATTLKKRIIKDD